MVRFVYQALGGQKDVGVSRSAGELCSERRGTRGEALDVFLLSGRVWAASGGEVFEGDGVDGSRPALEGCREKNASLNGAGD
jgi:hypothetical protein